jgi:hypothetical protein
VDQPPDRDAGGVGLTGGHGAADDEQHGGVEGSAALPAGEVLHVQRPALAHQVAEVLDPQGRVRERRPGRQLPHQTRGAEHVHPTVFRYVIPGAGDLQGGATRPERAQDLVVPGDLNHPAGAQFHPVIAAGGACHSPDHIVGPPPILAREGRYGRPLE